MKRQWLVGAIVLLLVLAIFVSSASYKKDVLEKAVFGGMSLMVEVADTKDARRQGLSNREVLRDNYGMLFVFESEALHGIWMKDMLVPIDMFWLDSKGQVVSIAVDVATSSYPNVFYPTAPARYVLETVAGFAKAHSIATGTSLLLKTPP